MYAQDFSAQTVGYFKRLNVNDQTAAVRPVLGKKGGKI